MGLALTLVAAIFMGLLALGAKRQLTYVLLILIICFEEAGEGFTSFNGSFVFSQNFVDFYKLKFIEFIIATVYFALLLSRQNAHASYLRFEKRLCWLFFALIAMLSILEFFLHEGISISDWRLILSGIMLFHILAMLVDTEEKLISFFRAFVIILSGRALIGLVAYFAGYGVMSPRGMVPFFWDSVQISAFAFGIIMLGAYLANFDALHKKYKVFPKVFAFIMLGILAVTVLLSLRRTILFIALLGIFLVLLTSKRVKFPQIAALGFIAFAGLLLVLTMPGLERFRDQMGGYLGSVNLFEAKVASSYENEVHLDNVQKYTQMILENPSILAFGYRGYPGAEFSSLRQKYSGKYPLGVAHNGVLRTIYFFGLAGLLIYLAFYIRLFMLFKTVQRLPDNILVKHIAIASLALLFLEFSSALTLVPPFYTSAKGLFYTFLAAFFVRASVFHSTANAAIQPTIRQQVTP